MGSRWLVLLAGGLSLFGLPVYLGLSDAAAPSAHAAASQGHGPTVALLATKPGAIHTSLYLVRTGETGSPAPVATFGHLPDATVRGAVVPGTSIVLATADTLPVRDASFNASLFRLEPHRPAELLCDRVVHSSRPLVTKAGRVFVSRGKAGPEVEGMMRIDELTVDEIDPATGSSRSIHTHSGYLAFLAGFHQDEVLLYRVGPSSADLIGVDPDTGKWRLITTLMPFARDFSVDTVAAAVVFQNRHPKQARTWVIDRVDLSSGKTTRLFESASMAMAPHVLPGGGIVYNPSGGGLEILGAKLGVSGPLGSGVDLTLSTTPDGSHLAMLHTVAGAFPTPFLLDTGTGKAALLPSLDVARVTLAGFVPTQGGAQ